MNNIEIWVIVENNTENGITPFYYKLDGAIAIFVIICQIKCNSSSNPSCVVFQCKHFLDLLLIKDRAFASSSLVTLTKSVCLGINSLNKPLAISLLSHCHEK